MISEHKHFESEKKMPVLFLGHGSPMNAIQDNEFTRGFRKIAENIPRPTAILCISAHWETNGTKLTAMELPRTIHDFGGFPDELFEIQYPAKGSPALAEDTKNILNAYQAELDYSWGLDHGAWSVIKHLYPDADVPVIQLSLDYRKKPADHYNTGKELLTLREKGVLIIGSGNMVHNLRLLDPFRINDIGYAYDWAEEAGSKMKQYILDDNHKSLVEYDSQGSAFKKAIPTPEHYLPLIYTLALKNENDETEIFNDKAVAGSLTMTSVKIG